MLEADGYQPYLISPEKGLRSLIKGVLELAKEPSRLCVDEVLLFTTHLCYISIYVSVCMRLCLIGFNGAGSSCACGYSFSISKCDTWTRKIS